MILSCSSCETRFLVDPDAIGPNGRRVRCARCGHVWRQEAPRDLPHRVDLTPPPSAPSIDIPFGSNLPALPRKPRSQALQWILLLVLFGGLAGAGIFYREPIVAAWPPASKLYDMVGLSAEEIGAGLVFRQVTPRHELRDGKKILEIRGLIANISERDREIPQVRVALIGPQGYEVRHWIFTANAETLEPGETLRFSTVSVDPPANAENLAIRFQR